ncbi:hypothetical protein [Serratia quinivorans]|uniref:hypothetical protein n=1 Tax=Serratia quinivorans TaxID=137545 RepID=UPI00217849C4|nr:hypothetical protein [Serratia quinivorans]CAI0943362.1 Uncharacterised protein [Serratia quinivorans]CAI1739889.1 Uncharacterised protein [Serratia quinivorans]
MKLPYPIDVNSLRDLPVFFSCIPVDLLDQDKRTLLEGRSIYHKPDASDYSACHYKGKRKRHPYPMNKAALKLAWQHTDEIIYTLQLLNLQAINLIKISAEEVTRADRLYAVALSGFKTANYHLANSVLNDAEFTYPPYLSALSKICHGLCHLIYNCDKRIINYCCDNNKIDDLYHYIDSQELLIGHQTKEVCAGPAVMIKDVLALFTHDRPIKSVEKLNPVVTKYYLYASITSLFELLSCHYEFYNICYFRILNKLPKKNNTIPYSHYLHNAPGEFIVKNIPILGKLENLAWCIKGYENLSGAINKLLDKIACRIEKKDFSDKNEIDIDCLGLFNELNGELFRLFNVRNDANINLQHLSFFFNVDSI